MLATLHRAVTLGAEIAETTELYAWGLEREVLALRGAMCAYFRGAASHARPEETGAP